MCVCSSNMERLPTERSCPQQVVAETQLLERRLQDLAGGMGMPSPSSLSKGGKSRTGAEEDDRERGSQVSTKLMRVVDQWMRHRDLQQALLRGAAINDQAACVS